MRVLAVTNMYPTTRSPYSGTFIEQQIRGLKSLGLNVQTIFVNRLEKGITTYLGLGRLLRFHAAHFEPNVVHVMYGGIMAEIVTRAIKDLPLVVTFHGSDLLGQPFGSFIRRLASRYSVLSSCLAARRADGIVVVSRKLQDSLPKQIDSDKVWIIPCGLDLKTFKPLDMGDCRRKLGLDPETFHILFPSRAGDRVKRFQLAQATLVKLRDSGISAQLHQLNEVPNKQVPLWLNACDVLILTSFQEGSPTIIKEALACNCPVVSVDVGDVCDRIEGIRGCYLALPTPNDLAAKLQLVFNGPRQVEGRVKMQEFSLERVAQRLVDVYLAVINQVADNTHPLQSVR